MSEKYKTASQYQIEADVTLDGATVGNSASHIAFTFKAPDKYRMQSGIAGAEGLTVHDGATLWFYFPKLNQYGSFPASALKADAPGDLGDARPQAMDNFMMWRYRAAADSLDRAKFMREESIEIAGTKIDCYVVMVSPQKSESRYTWWIDKTRNLILREDHANSSTVFTSIKLNQPIRDDLFIFDPPPGAQKLPTQP